ncbi:MAG TPA: SEC-C domain-containing protein [Anaerolineae bacterium]|nr:SEC-C domain-containing protein [Anaerolineae bacterium]
MTKTGRNDPCPCGSGKKYKHCCLRQETAGKSEAMGRDRAWDTMIEKLLDFSREARFRKDLEAAFDLFWNRSYTIEQVSELAPAQIMNFLDWYAHDYRTADDGQRIVEIFLDEKGPALSQQERDLLRGDSEALLSAFEVTSLEEGQVIGLRDVFQDLETQLPHTPSLQGIKAGQLLLARLALSNGYRRFSWISALIPPEVVADFKAHINEMFDLYQEEHFKASWAQFLRERSYLFNHYLLELRGEVAPPRILLPYAERAEGGPRPTVLTLENIGPKERPSVVVPGRTEGKPSSRVLVPGRDT